jgi:hypothetical protein
MTINGKCYSCCGNDLSIFNNQCYCDGNPCPAC